MIFSLVIYQDYNEFTSFTNLTEVTFKMIENFTKCHVETMIIQFEPHLIVKIIEFICLGLMVDNENKNNSSKEMAGTSTYSKSFNSGVLEMMIKSIHSICTTIYASREKLNDYIAALLDSAGSIFKDVLKIILKTVIYEEHKMIWIFQKPLFAVIIINGKDDYDDVKAEILQSEPDITLREKIAYELEQLTMNVELSIDKYNREKFSSNFSRFKNALVKFK